MTAIDAIRQAEETIDNLVGPEERESYALLMGRLQRAMGATNSMVFALQDVVNHIHDPNMPMKELTNRCKIALMNYMEV